MPKLIEFMPHGLKCDATGCGWRDDGVTFNFKTNGREFLNRPCPDCGSNLYTMADFRLVRRMRRAAGAVNALFGWIVWFTPKSRRHGERVSFSSDGRGFVTSAVVEEGGVWEKLLAKPKWRCKSCGYTGFTHDAQGRLRGECPSDRSTCPLEKIA